MTPADRLFSDEGFRALSESARDFLVMLYARCDAWGRLPTGEALRALLLSSKDTEALTGEVLAFVTPYTGTDGARYLQLADYDRDISREMARKRGRPLYPDPITPAGVSAPGSRPGAVVQEDAPARRSRYADQRSRASTLGEAPGNGRRPWNREESTSEGRPEQTFGAPRMIIRGAVTGTAIMAAPTTPVRASAHAPTRVFGTSSREDLTSAAGGRAYEPPVQVQEATRAWLRRLAVMSPDLAVDEGAVYALAARFAPEDFKAGVARHVRENDPTLWVAKPLMYLRFRCQWAQEARLHPRAPREQERDAKGRPLFYAMTQGNNRDPFAGLRYEENTEVGKPLEFYDGGES